MNDELMTASASPTPTKLLQACHDRLSAALNDRYMMPDFETLSRLMIGADKTGRYQARVGLHPLYGFPELTGSTLSGAASHVAFEDAAAALGLRPRSDEERQTEHKANRRTPYERLAALLETEAQMGEAQVARQRAYESLCQQGEREDEAAPPSYEAFEARHTRPYRSVFGTAARKGQVTFHGALPTALLVEGKPIIEWDVITPHHTQYYETGEAPDDTDDPVPVPVLAVRAGVPFQVYIGGEAEWKVYATSLVERALTEYGVGGRKGVGYGLFKTAERP